jgi:hypothetical protein
MIIYYKTGRYYIEDRGHKFQLAESELDFIDFTTGIKFIYDRWPPDNSRSKLERDHLYADILNREGVAHGSNFEDVMDGIHSGVDVNIQDQTTDVIIQKFNQVHNSTTLNGAVAIEEEEIIVTDATGIVAGSHLILFDPASVRFSTFIALTPSGTTIPLDRPLDFAYPDGTFVDVAITNMAVDGSVTTQVFGLRGTGAPPGVDLDVDITRIIITMLTTNPVAYDLFGDLPALTKGVTVRVRNGKYFNIVNFKTNGELAGAMYDLTSAEAVNPNQGQNGYIGRMTFAGTNKMGVAIRLPIGEDLEILIQDNLSLIEKFEVVAEGHIVEK